MMKSKIADLIIDTKKVGSLAPHLRDYLYEGHAPADLVIKPELYDPSIYEWEMSPDILEYMESGRQFHAALLQNNGLYLHASAVELDGRAYLFSGPCGTGKSTHTRLWQQLFGEKARIFNDDKPALRRLEDRWYAYGTPWCGKDHININMKAPLAGICFLKQADDNRIRRLSPAEAATKIISQTIRRFKKAERLDLMLSHVDRLAREIPVFELENRPETEAAMLSYETMKEASREAGL